MQAITIEILSKNDLNRFIETIRLFEDVFEMEKLSIPSRPHLQNLLNKDDFYVFVAILGGKVVGGLTAYTIHQYYSEKPLAYIYDLAVDTTSQRQGIGKKLIAAINTFCQKNGFQEVFVQVDKEDNHAIDFYHTTQPTREDQVIHFSYSIEK